jgi:hypothetical protein
VRPRSLDRFAVADLLLSSAAEGQMSILLAIVIALLILSLPAWPYSAAWGYYPSGGLGIVVLVLLILLLFNRRTV